MVPPRKRKLYTPVTPPDEENEDNRVSVQQFQQQQEIEIKKIPEKINCATFTNIVNENFSFKTSPIEMAENRAWKSLKAHKIFRKAPTLVENGKVFHRLNSIEIANSIAIANIKERELKSEVDRENLNVLDVIAQKLIKERCKVEKSINPHDGQQQQQMIEVKCEGLKSIFMEHDDVTTTDGIATDTRVKSEQGFVLSHLKATANTESSDDCEITNKQSVHKPLISEDVFNDWINSSTPVKDNPRDRGIFPQTPSLSRSRKGIKKKAHLNTSHFLQ